MPVRAVEEQVVHPEGSFSVVRFAYDRLEPAWHAHAHYELTYLTAGRGRRFVGDRVGTYADGELVLLGPELPHAWTSDASPGTAIVVRFRADFLGKRFLALPEFAVALDLLRAADRGLAFPPAVAAAIAGRLFALVEAEPLERLLLLLEVLGALAAARADATRLASGGYRPSPPAAVGPPVPLVIAYLEQRYRHPITLAELSAIAHMAPSSLSRAFRRATGRTITRYVNELRIGGASRQLLASDDPITTIAFDNGFTNLSNFNRRFRERNGMTPSAYRRTLASSAADR